MSATPLRGLVLVRMGAGRRMADWLAVPSERRNWDQALSLYVGFRAIA